MKKVGKWFTALVVVGALAGCARTAPIENVRTTVGTGHTAEQVKSAIFKAGVQRQWIMNEAGPGVIKARQQNRDHVAEVRINYTATGYTINYDSSLNLQAANGKIHKNYNRWVNNLDKDIQVNLSAISAH
ncbi:MULTISPECIES: lipoprotein [Phytobacter]|jgi:predicted small lipoprotein YifL|uniref:Lipoprotein n=1 Tax=Citrobacter bitternis TaxID=1585982 RepID=A0ABW1Q6K9_9ENTR|nr:MULTISPECIES: lipoprotein [Phytobacter]MBY6257652.1 hypothetical protein [Phytobacter diazotrophicus]MDV2905086.1 hypothetical protein [Phytobacter diazotrophicus]PTA95406.1 hypothetical protein C9415_10720 [Kluyvera sp. Nf5]SFE18152.1 Predicted small lipoprotein YifL [Phytobacter palmae]